MNSLFHTSFNTLIPDTERRSNSTKYMTIAQKTKLWVQKKIKKKKKLGITLDRSFNHSNMLETDTSLFNPQSSHFSKKSKISKREKINEKHEGKRLEMIQQFLKKRSQKGNGHVIDFKKTIDTIKEI